MIVALIATIFTVVYTAVNPLNNDLEMEWSAFKFKYGKEYNSSSEENIRKEIFTNTFNKIIEHNNLYKQGLVSYSMTINKYSDRTTEEINKNLKGYRKSTRTIKGFEKVSFVPVKEVIVPDEVDWRDLGAVTGVKDQLNCGSCWAFSTTGALEAQYFLKTGSLTPLSEQNLVDCSNQGANDGCDGGDPTDAFAYVHFNDGIDSEETYPYVAKNGICDYTNDNNVTSIRLFGDVESGNEEYLKAAVATIGPVTTDIYADDSFTGYESGVYYNACCEDNDPNHSVLIIGYGTTKNNVDYWLVKNSWGEDWGEDGYIRMARNNDNNCGIATSAGFPIMY